MSELFTVLLISVGLAMDTFAVSISNSMTKPNLTKWQYFAYPLAFGIFQGLMPLIGYFVGMTFESIVVAVDHWIALVLLSFIGLKMLIESIKQVVSDKKKRGQPDSDEITEQKNSVFSFGEMIVQAIATSIDALAVGISFALTISMNIFVSVGIIAVITFAISLLGMFIGKKVGGLLGNVAGIFGGLILIGIGLKIFIEHIIVG